MKRLLRFLRDLDFSRGAWWVGLLLIGSAIFYAVLLIIAATWGG